MMLQALALPPPPCVTFCLVIVSLRGPGSSLRMLRRVAAFCRPLRPVLPPQPPARPLGLVCRGRARGPSSGWQAVGRGRGGKELPLNTKSQNSAEVRYTWSPTEHRPTHNRHRMTAHRHSVTHRPPSHTGWTEGIVAQQGRGIWGHSALLGGGGGGTARNGHGAAAAQC